MFSTAFQANAFQVNAFQIYIPPPPSDQKVGGDDASWTEDDLKRLRKLSAKIAERQRKLEQATKEGNASRKQAFKDLIDPVAKVKQPKVQSNQEVKADIPSVDTQELQRSISYLEKQRDNILEAVAYRHQQYLIQEQLRVMEAKRQEELDDEAALLLLLQTHTHNISQPTTTYTLAGTLLALGYLSTVGIQPFLPIKQFLMQDCLQPLKHGKASLYQIKRQLCRWSKALAIYSNMLGSCQP